MPVFPTVGSFPLTGVANLPNVTIAFPGEHWSNRIASGAIQPGEACVEVSLGGKLAVRRAANAAEAASKIGSIATRVIDPPDRAGDSLYTTSVGPNEIKNLPMAHGDYVHSYYSGVFHLTLVVPRAWAPGELVAWAPAGARPTGKAGVGSWDLAGSESTAVFSVMEFRPFSADGLEGLLTVRSLRGQF